MFSNAYELGEAGGELLFVEHAVDGLLGPVVVQLL